MGYQPRKMEAYQVVAEIKNVYSLVKWEDISGDVAPTKYPGK